jgi:hypothetical protein
MHLDHRREHWPGTSWRRTQERHELQMIKIFVFHDKDTCMDKIMRK